MNIIRIGQQLQYFQQYQQRVSALLGPEQTQALVNQALVLITLGGNDFVNNYFLVPFSARSRQFSLQNYVPYVVSEYRKVLLVRLYSLLCYDSFVQHMRRDTIYLNLDDFGIFFFEKLAHLFTT